MILRLIFGFAAGRAKGRAGVVRGKLGPGLSFGVLVTRRYSDPCMLIPGVADVGCRPIGSRLDISLETIENYASGSFKN